MKLGESGVRRRDFFGRLTALCLSLLPLSAAGARAKSWREQKRTASMMMPILPPEQGNSVPVAALVPAQAVTPFSTHQAVTPFSTHAPDHPPADNDGDLLNSMDALLWAERFCLKFPGNDVQLMHTWFAGAIMTGFDEGRRRYESTTT